MHESAHPLLEIDFCLGLLWVLLLTLYQVTGSDWAMALESVFRSCSICGLTAPVDTRSAQFWSLWGPRPRPQSEETPTTASPDNVEDEGLLLWHQ